MLLGSRIALKMRELRFRQAVRVAAPKQYIFRSQWKINSNQYSRLTKLHCYHIIG